MNTVTRRGLLAAGAAGAALAAAGIRPARAAAPVEIKVGHGHSASHSFNLAMERFGAYLEAAAPGRYKVSIYPNAELGSETEMQQQLTLGTLEIAVTGVLGVYEPKLNLLELPYLFRDRKQIRDVQQSQAVADLAASLPAKGLRLIGFLENGWRDITNNVHPINSPDDVKDMKIRTPEDEALVQTFKALGAQPTPMPFSELYSALKQGVVDGQENPLQNIADAKFYEVQKYLAITHHVYNSAYVAISEQFLQSQDATGQKLITDAVTKACNWQMDLLAKKDVELLQALKDKGMKVTEPDTAPFKAATAPVYDVFYKKYGDAARTFVSAVRATGA